MSDCQNLHRARKVRDNEFYTMRADIDKELAHYEQHFKDRTVYCNCDDPFRSNFVRYFIENFERLGLKRLIATCYDKDLTIHGERIQGAPNEDMPHSKAYLLDIEHPLKEMTMNDVKTLKGNGDFRSKECLALLDGADIVCTNPPFSLFKYFIPMLLRHKKQFLVIGPLMAIGYLPMITSMKQGNVRFGHEHVKEFLRPDGMTQTFGNTLWFTNLEHGNKNEPLQLTKRYTPERYPRYDNFDVIEVSEVKDIPMDYDGIMGVPVSFTEKWCSQQFDLIGCSGNHTWVRKKCTFYQEPMEHVCNKLARMGGGCMG